MIPIKKFNKIEEAFTAGKAGMVVQKLGSILGKRIGEPIIFSEVPLMYENDYGTFAGYLGSISNGRLYLKINFKLTSSDSITSVDFYDDDVSRPQYTVDMEGLNIVQIVNAITEELVEDGEVDDSMMEGAPKRSRLKVIERGRPSKPVEDFIYILEKWVEQEPSVLKDLQNKPLPDVFSASFLKWVSDKPRYKEEMKYYFFAKVVRAFLLGRGLTNKTFRKRKKGSKERQVEDPILQAQFEEVVENISWEEKFEFLKGSVAQMMNGAVQSIYIHGDPGCLAKDTKLKIVRGNRRSWREYTIEEAFAKLNHNKSKLSESKKYFRYWDKSYTTSIMSYNENGYLETQPIKEIVFSGKKDVFVVSTNNGAKIKCTKDHKFYTEEGYKRVEDLQVGDKVLVQDLHKSNLGRKKGRKIQYSIPYHPYGNKAIVDGKDYKRLPYSRLLIEADMNNITIDDFITILKNDEDKARSLKYLRDGLEVHHKDFDQTNDILSNLEILTKAEHTKKHKLNSKYANKETRTSYSKIASIEFVGLEDTYDIEMENPLQPNFLAQGFIVHNSGKSHEVINTLDDLNANYKLYKGAFKGTDEAVRVLYNNREDTILVFDDADSIIKNKDQISIFKAALENRPVREITYVDVRRGKNMEDIPPKFDFTSGVIFISNIHASKIDSAITSRSLVLEISLSNEEMADKIEKTLKEYRPEVSMDIKKKALEYAKEIAPGVTSIDYRVLDNIIIAMKISPNSWKKMVLLLIQNI